ncbi:MAG: carboxypeptidase-like regulatory domain-containing protein [Hyalangium sp.]|uniref:carboxypeptidase-like regulatory domain-containing protein n=1 Tax=Hyalangium sp. TaxID=2028555 RepID=UPI003899C22A
MRTMLKWVVTAGLAGMLTSCGNKSSGGGPDSGDTGGTGTVQAGALKGRVVDTKGQPLSGAVIYAAITGTNGVPSKTTTDAQGTYKLSDMAGSVTYKALAWLPLTYRGKSFCLRISPEDASGNEVFLPKDGAIRNFHWRLQGRMDDSPAAPDEDGAWYGGTIKLFPEFDDGDYKSTIELQLTPTEPLIDGSTGEVLTRTVDLGKTQYALDIPVGVYKISASRVKTDGTRVSARLGPSNTTTSSETVFEFKPTDMPACGSATVSSGVTRGFLSVLSP